MSSPLIERYTFGIKNIGFPGPESDFFFGIPKRQREMIEITKRQIEAQKASAKYIAESNLQASEMIGREIKNQTQVLEKAVGELGGDIVNALDYLGERISGDLSEIRWELEQLRSLSDQILEVLRRPRSTEAQELIRQGVRHLINNEIVEAEDRLRKALEKDSTDYQVLMNLSYVALHKEQADEAIMLTNKALTLPESLDKQAKADALWSLSRIYYTLEQFDQSYSMAKKAIDVVATPKRLYQTGIYKVLSGNKAEGIALIHQAILQNPSLFVLAATDPDLETARQDILSLLDQLSQNIRKKTDQSWQELSRSIKTIENFKESSQYTDLLSRLLAICGKIKPMLDAPSYSAYLTSLSVITSLQELLAEFNELKSLYVDRSNLTVKLKNINEDIGPTKKDIQKLIKESSKIEEGESFQPIIFPSLGVLFFGFFAVLFATEDLAIGVLGGIIPLILFLYVVGKINNILKKKSFNKSITILGTNIAPLELEALKITNEIASLTKQIESIHDRIIAGLDSIVKNN